MKENQIVSIGVIIMDMFPAQLGVNLVDVKEFRPMPGGACANVAVGIAKFGVKSAFIGKVGNDYFGRYLGNVLKGYQVDVSGLVYDDTRRTTMNFHAKPCKNEIQYLFYRTPGADTNLSVDEVDYEKIKCSRAIHFDSLCLTDEPTRGTVMEIIRIAKENGVLVSFDFNYRDVLWKSSMEAVDCIKSVLKDVDIFKMNDAEYGLLYGSTDIENGTKEIMKLGPQLCIVTRGKNGSYIAYMDKSVSIPVLEVPVVDTIGCGDSFISSFLAFMIKNEIDFESISRETLEKCGIFADTAASLTAAREGAMPALPEYDEVEKIYQGRIKR